MDTTTNAMFTLGHSSHTIEEFIHLLHMHKVDVIADVRSKPYSAFAPQFNREQLEQSLRKEGINYVFMGKQLGARPDDPSCYIQGHVSFSRIAATPLFKEGISRVIKGAEKYHIALMCAEKEPLDCHRTILVAQALYELRIHIQHIHADGTLESHSKALERLMELRGVPHVDLFLDRSELIRQAIKRQEERIAYIEPNDFEENEGNVI